MTEQNFQLDIAIDPNIIEEEWLSLPGHIIFYSEESANIIRDLEIIKKNLSLLRSKKGADIREHPERYSYKLTVDAINELIESDLEIRDLQNQIIEKTYHYNLLKGVLVAFDAKKKALENIVTLINMGLISTPKEPKNLAPGKRMAASSNVSSYIRQKLNENKS